MAIICRIMPCETANGSTGQAIILELHTNGATRRTVIAGTQNLSMNIGDSIKCVSGMAIVMINPGTGAGAYILCTKLPTPNNGKYLTELEITDELTKVINRGKISVVEDIGTILTATGKSIR